MSEINEKWEDVRAELLEDASFKKAYDALGPKYEIISQMIDLRASLNLTQAQLAERMGTKQSSISRLERGTCNPKLDLNWLKASGKRCMCLLGKKEHDDKIGV